MGVQYSIFGTARKKVGGVVFAKGQDGKIITRSYQGNVKNPKTSGQQLQRAIFNTVTTAYSQLKEICDHSFEGIAYKAKSQQYFMKRNLSLLRSMVAAGSATNLNIKGNPFAQLNPFIISKGSLPYVPVLSVDANSIIFGSYQDDEPSWTVGDLKKITNMQNGDQITFVLLESIADGSYIGYGSVHQYRTLLHLARIIIKTDATDEMLLTSNNSWNDAAVSVSTTNKETIALGTGTDLNNNKGYLELSFLNASSENPSMAAVILSRKNGNDWLRSFAQLTPMGAGVEPSLIYPSYGANASIEFPSSWYLNQGQSAGTTEVVTAAGISSVVVGNTTLTNGGTGSVDSGSYTPVVNGTKLAGNKVKLAFQPSAGGSETTIFEGVPTGNTATSTSAWSAAAGIMKVYLNDNLAFSATITIEQP